MASNNHLCAVIFLSQHIDKCQEKILYIVYTRAYQPLEIALKSNKYEHLLTNYSEIVQYGFIRSILCLLLDLKAGIREFFGFQEQKADENKNTNASLGCADACAFFTGHGSHRFDRTGKIDSAGGSHCRSL
jgi:hypothetical protein